MFKKKSLKKWSFALGGLFFLLLTSTHFQCKEDAAKLEQQHSDWLNVYDTSAHYVGIQTCASCHQDIYKTYMQTGMGQSFDSATQQKSAADFTPAHAIVYDDSLDFYYQPYWDQGNFYIKEFRLEGKDTIHKRVEKVSYIVGSGQHTNSHMMIENGYVNQLPITFYTQKQQWDLAPGFEKGANSRFGRIIELECMSCHNAYPNIDPSSQNKFLTIKKGIDCERCHGPGSLHVKDKQNGILVDTSKGPDYSIVNPRRLPTDLQNNICQRCHLQGITVLNDGKTFFDFRPGMHLSVVMNVFMPIYKGAKDKMIMASHVERMKMSNCYLVSQKMSCITCHNPHVSVKYTPRKQYNDACISCHSSADKSCKEQSNIRNQKQNDCVTCHMPRNGSIDIPHVAVTDHYIRKRPLNKEEKSAITAFLGLKSYNNDNPDAITSARAYMEFFERYNSNVGLIDSALHYLNKALAVEEKEKQNKDFIRAYFLKNNFNKVVDYAKVQVANQCKDAWMAYRVGESYTKLNQHVNALPWYQQAVSLMPNALDFQNKLGVCYAQNNKAEDAERTFKYVLQENPKHSSANVNLAYLYMQQNRMVLAFDYLNKANDLDPDNEQNLFNLAIWYHQSHADTKAAIYLKRILKRAPNNERAKAMLLDLTKTNP